MSLKKKKISKNFTTTENKLKTTKKNEIKKCENTAPLFFLLRWGERGVGRKVGEKPRFAPPNIAFY